MRGCGGLERTDFLQFLSLGVYDGLKRTDLSTVSALGHGCGVHERTAFFTVSTLRCCGGLEQN